MFIYLGRKHLTVDFKLVGIYLCIQVSVCGEFVIAKVAAPPTHSPAGCVLSVSLY